MSEDTSGWCRPNEDWLPGDLARCVRDDFYPKRDDDPRVGDVLTVSALRSEEMIYLGTRWYLRFEERAHDRQWQCQAFVKVDPEEYEVSDETKALLGDILKPSRVREREDA